MAYVQTQPWKVGRQWMLKLNFPLLVIQSYQGPPSFLFFFFFSQDIACLVIARNSACLIPVFPVSSISCLPNVTCDELLFGPTHSDLRGLNGRETWRTTQSYRYSVLKSHFSLSLRSLLPEDNGKLSTQPGLREKRIWPSIINEIVPAVLLHTGSSLLYAEFANDHWF